jgi:putative oxidoreductase
MVALLRTFGKIEHWFAKSEILPGFVLLALRLWIAKYFFSAGLTKIANFDTTIALFADEYHVPILMPKVAAIMATTAELSLPVLLALGLMTRYSALGLFIMTAVIELFIYPGTTEHYHLLLIMASIMVFGSGRLGLDRWMFGRP